MKKIVIFSFIITLISSQNFFGMFQRVGLKVLQDATQKFSKDQLVQLQVLKKLEQKKMFPSRYNAYEKQNLSKNRVISAGFLSIFQSSMVIQKRLFSSHKNDYEKIKKNRLAKSIVDLKSLDASSKGLLLGAFVIAPILTTLLILAERS